MLRFIIRAIVASGLLLGIVSAAPAQVLPSKVTILVPFAPGGPVDFTARQLADGLRQQLNVVVVVENKPGANGVLAANTLIQSPPDGGTLLVTGQGLMTINQFLTKMTFDPLKDLTAISGLAYSDTVLVVSSSVPANNMAEFVALARKANPPLSFAHAGVGNILHLYAERLRSLADINFTYVPYKGVQPAIQDVAGGFVTGVFSGVVSALPLINGKQVKALGVIGDKRSPVVPAVPTMAEQGYPIEDVAWFALIGPPKMPADRAKAIADVVAKIMNEPARDAAMANLGLYPWLKNPDELTKQMADESGRWKELITRNHIVGE
jgi:tripartite-type tricarboxylate transporter receptor subunit TctC